MVNHTSKRLGRIERRYWWNQLISTMAGMNYLTHSPSDFLMHPNYLAIVIRRYSHVESKVFYCQIFYCNCFIWNKIGKHRRPFLKALNRVRANNVSKSPCDIVEMTLLTSVKILSFVWSVKSGDVYNFEKSNQSFTMLGGTIAASKGFKGLGTSRFKGIKVRMFKDI